ncbi:uncharacterized protein LOC141649393 [Silene latifolia]|uniref:uncharacterized protein LOC141649393 n=1 Tax=Silene latifolia TaxID=37657 RepID=UPI003D77BD82
MGKSNVYFNGVNNDLRKEIAQVSGCIEGKLPFKYLGVPIKPSKLSIKSCQPLIDKVLEGIRMLGTKKLSYAGRLVLIKAVYKTLHSYWASLFIIPKAILVRIEAICRNFLWNGGTEYIRSPTVAWTKICTDQQKGGLGLRVESIWNKATIGKLVWWVHYHPSKLWVQWVHNIYLKGMTWEDYNPPNEASWTWKKVCKMRKDLKEAYDQNEWSNVPGKEYTTKKDTTEKLHRLGISLDNSCCICEQEEESIQHLFFRYQYGRRVIQRLQEWTGMHLSAENIQNWRHHRRFTRLKTGILNSIINSVMYHIWMQRNESRHEYKIISPRRCAIMIQGDVKARIQQQAKGTMSRKDRQWLERIM